MNHPNRFGKLWAIALLLALTAACGSDEDGAPVTQAEDPHGGEEPTTAVTHPDFDAVPPVPVPPTPEPSPAPVPAPVEELPPATGAPQLVLLHTHELLRSEERQIEALLSTLRRASVTLERVPAGDRAAALDAWLGEADPAVRAQMALGQARGNARAVLVLRVAAPVEQRARGVAAFGVIGGEPARERLWAQGDLPPEARAGLAAFLADGGQP